MRRDAQVVQDVLLLRSHAARRLRLVRVACDARRAVLTLAMHLALAFVVDLDDLIVLVVFSAADFTDAGQVLNTVLRVRLLNPFNVALVLAPRDLRVAVQAQAIVWCFI